MTDKHMEEVMREFDRRFSGIPVEFMANGTVTYSTEEVKEFVDTACRMYARGIVDELTKREKTVQKEGWITWGVPYTDMEKMRDRLTDKEPT